MLSKSELGFEFEIIAYQDEKGSEPFSDWLSKLNFKLQNIVISRLNRVKLGNFGDCKHLIGKVYELKIHIDAGYRIYFSREGKKIILLLCAGDKSSQKKDIKKAQNLLEKYYDKNGK